MTTQHNARELAQVALGVDGVQAADVFATPDDEDSAVEIVVAGGAVPNRLLAVLAERGVALDPDKTATRGSPTHTVVVAVGASLVLLSLHRIGLGYSRV